MDCNSLGAMQKAQRKLKMSYVFDETQIEMCTFKSLFRNYTCSGCSTFRFVFCCSSALAIFSLDGGAIYGHFLVIKLKI